MKSELFKKEKAENSEPKTQTVTAKKDWRIFAPPKFDIIIKAGQPIDHVPKQFIQTLKTENVI